jgi:hypothetical protein
MPYQDKDQLPPHFAEKKKKGTECRKNKTRYHPSCRQNYTQVAGEKDENESIDYVVRSGLFHRRLLSAWRRTTLMGSRLYVAASGHSLSPKR